MLEYNIWRVMKRNEQKYNGQDIADETRNNTTSGIITEDIVDTKAVTKIMSKPAGPGLYHRRVVLSLRHELCR